MKRQNIVLTIFVVSFLACFSIFYMLWDADEADACCLSALGFGPFGQKSSLVGLVYLQTDPDVPIEGAIVYIQYEDEPSLTGCTYMGDVRESNCSASTEHGWHYNEWDPYYNINVGSLVPLNEEGVLSEPVDLQITAVYTLNNQRYEASAIYTLDPDKVDAYGNQRVDITLSVPAGGGVINGADVAYLTLENVTDNGQGGVTLIPEMGINSLLQNNMSLLESYLPLATQPAWWNDEYQYRRLITLNGNLSTGTIIKLDKIDFSQLELEGKVRADKFDVRIVRFNESTETWQEVARNYITEWNVDFKLITSLNGEDTSYWLYYGNPNASSPPTFTPAPQGWWVDMYHDKWWSDYGATATFNRTMDFNDICSSSSINHRGIIGTSFDESDRFRSRLFIPETGTWTFQVYTNDGYRLSLDGSEVGRFDGYDGNRWTTIGSASLKAGWHQMDLRNMWVNCGAWRFRMQGPNFSNQIVPAHYFQRLEVGRPSISVNEEEDVSNTLSVTGIATTTHIALPSSASWSQAVITADLTLPDTITLTVLNTEGQALQSFALQDGSNQLDLSILPPTDLQLKFTLEGVETPAIQSWELQWEPQQQLSYRFGGQILDGRRQPLKGANVQILQGTSVIAETQTDAYGFYTSPILDVMDNLYVRVLLRHGTSTNYTFRVRYGANDTLNGPVIYRQTVPFNLSSDSPFTTYVAHVDFTPYHTQFSTNLPDPDKLDDVAAIYHHTEQVMNFVQKELDVTTISPFDVSAYAGNVTYYDEEHQLIVLGANYSDYKNANRPMNREWHETFHHIMAATIGMPMSDCDGNNQNHGGYENCSTSDSYAEGFAEYWSTVLGAHLGYQPRPDWYYIGIGNNGQAAIPLEYNWKAWEKSCHFCPSREEFAVASLLWDLSDPVKRFDHDYIQIEVEAVWQLLAYNQINNVFDLYQTLQQADIGQTVGENTQCGLNHLDLLFVEHGFFYDADDDRRYDCGEEVGRAADAGRPGRRAAPTTNTLIDIQSNVYPVTVTVAYEYPDMPHLNFQYEVALETGYLYIEPTPVEHLANITISGYTANSVATQPMQFTNQEYWAWVNTYGPGIVQVHELGMVEGTALQLEAGWNLTTIPITRTDMSPEGIFADQTGLVYGYDGCEPANTWQSYDPDPPPFAPPNRLNTIDPTLGYWVYSDASQTIPITGTHNVTNSRQLCIGWNLISSPVTETMLIETATQPISDVLGLVYTYEDGVWQRYDPNPPLFAPPNDLVFMKPNQAYWVQVTQPVTWEVP